MAKLGPHFVQLKIEDQMIKMKFDKNSSVSVMNQEQYFSLFQNSLCETKINSINVDGSNLVIIGQTNVLVECCNSVFNLTLLIAHAENDFIPVIGSCWLNTLIAELKIDTLGEIRTNIGTKCITKPTDLVENSLKVRPRGHLKEIKTSGNYYNIAECSSVRDSQNRDELDFSSLFLSDITCSKMFNTSNSSNEHYNLTTYDADLQVNGKTFKENDLTKICFNDNVTEKSEQTFFIDNVGSVEHKIEHLENDGNIILEIYLETFVYTLFMLFTINVVVFCQFGMITQKLLLNLCKQLQDILTSIAKLQRQIIVCKRWTKILDNRFVVFGSNDNITKSQLCQGGIINNVQAIFATIIYQYLDAYVCYSFLKPKRFLDFYKKELKIKISLALVKIHTIMAKANMSYRYLRFYQQQKSLTSGEFHNFNSFNVFLLFLMKYFIIGDLFLSNMFKFTNKAIYQIKSIKCNKKVFQMELVMENFIILAKIGIKSAFIKFAKSQQMCWWKLMRFFKRMVKEEVPLIKSKLIYNTTTLTLKKYIWINVLCICVFKFIILFLLCNSQKSLEKFAKSLRRLTQVGTHKERHTKMQLKEFAAQDGVTGFGNPEDAVVRAGCSLHRDVHREFREYAKTKITSVHDMQSSEVEGLGFDWWRSRWKSSVAEWQKWLLKLNEIKCAEDSEILH